MTLSSQPFASLLFNLYFIFHLHVHVQLKSKLAKIYGTHLSDLTLRFDGETLDDDLCPKNFDMEDEDMIDVEVRMEYKL